MRIITGTAKGCKLKTPAGMSTRPTSDRMKESLFSILGEDVLENRVLDIFAGTGGLGLEALSRGAASAVFIDKATADIIAFNAQHTNLADKCRILAGDVFVHLQRLEQQGFLIYEHLQPREITQQYFTACNRADPAHPLQAFAQVNYCLAVKR